MFAVLACCVNDESFGYVYEDIHDAGRLQYMNVVLMLFKRCSNAVLMLFKHCSNAVQTFDDCKRLRIRIVNKDVCLYIYSDFLFVI